MLVISDYTFEKVMAHLDPSSRDLLINRLAEDAAMNRESDLDRTSNSTNNSATAGFCLRPISQSTAGNKANVHQSNGVVTSPMAPRDQV
jgi:hypothetical protein